MTIRWPSALGVTGLILALATIANAEGADKAPELKVLDRLVGTWTTKMVRRPTDPTAKRVQSEGVMVGSWILGGRFLQCQGTSKSDSLSDLQLFTYDPVKKAYRHWYFSSEGVTDETTGEWNEAKKTFTWKGELRDGSQMVNQMHFLDANRQEWKLRVTDKTGKLITDLEGTLTRRE